MPRQEGHNPLVGTIDNLTYYKSADGWKVRKKSGVKPGRILKDPSFERTRENMNEFKHVSVTRKMIRETFNPLLKHVADRKMPNRLTTVLFDILKTDTVNERGQRQISAGDLQLLRYFDLNGNNTFSHAFSPEVSIELDRGAGTVKLSVPAYRPEKMINYPYEGTHYRLVLGLAELSLETGEHKMLTAESDPLDLKIQDQPAFSLDLNFTAGSDKTLFILAGIDFYQERNGSMKMLKSGAFNALRILEVNES